MRHIQYFLLFSLLILASSCEDDLGDKYGYDGDWTLLAVSGGFSGGGVPVPWDNINIEDSNFSLFDGNELLLSAKLSYTEGEKFDLVGFDFIHHVDNLNLIFDTFYEKEIFLDEYGLLTISDGCCDLYAFTFERF